MEYLDKQVRKGVLGDNNYKDKFLNLTVYASTESINKLKEMRSYCFEKQRCFNCGSKYEGVTTNDSNDLILRCGNCLSNDVLSDKISRDYVKWYNEVYVDKEGGIPLGDDMEFPVIPELDISLGGRVKVKDKIKVVKRSSNVS